VRPPAVDDQQHFAMHDFTSEPNVRCDRRDLRVGEGQVWKDELLIEREPPPQRELGVFDMDG
jgi:hypothetical protein